MLARARSVIISPDSRARSQDVPRNRFTASGGDTTRVLVIEDNQRHAELISEELEDSGLVTDLQTAATCAAAVERLAREAFDLILLDYRLPDGDGIEVMRDMRARGIRTAVIFVTTADSVDLAVEAMKLGAEDFVQKQEGYLEVLPLRVKESLERQRIRRERDTLEVELRQSEKLASLGILASGLAHNINNRLTSLNTFFELIDERRGDENLFGEFLDTCREDLKKIEHLIHELTRYAFAGDQNRPPMAITELVARAISYLEDEIERKQIRLRTVFREVPRIPLDPEGIKQLVVNLVKNAVQVSPVGGAITVTVAEELGPAREIVVRVEDEGPGMPAEVRERIFDPFFTTKDNGMGIGLYLCHKIVALHEGRIDVANRGTGGAVFAVHLPIDDAETPAGSEDAPDRAPDRPAPLVGRAGAR